MSMVRGPAHAAMPQACGALLPISLPQPLRLPVAHLQELAGIYDPQMLAPHTRQHFHPSQLLLAHLCPPQSDLLLEVLLGGHFYFGRKGTLLSWRNRKLLYSGRAKDDTFSLCRLSPCETRISNLLRLGARWRAGLWFVRSGTFRARSSSTAGFDRSDSDAGYPRTLRPFWFRREKSTDRRCAREQQRGNYRHQRPYPQPQHHWHPESPGSGLRAGVQEAFCRQQQGQAVHLRWRHSRFDQDH